MSLAEKWEVFDKPRSHKARNEAISKGMLRSWARRKRLKKLIARKAARANKGAGMSTTRELEYFALNMAEAEKMYNLLQQAKKAINAVGHRQSCSFGGCNCGAVENFKLESAEFWRQVQAIESNWRGRSGDTK